MKAYRRVVCVIHDCYNNDMIKINDATHHILFRNCVFYNQTDGEGFQHFDINTCTDVRLEDSIFFNDYAGSGRRSANRSQGFIVAKNSGSTPDVTRRIALRRNIFLNWDGKPDMAFILLGEDGKPFTEAQQVMIENNLFIHNSPVRTWGTLLYKGGLKDITFRANTVVGHPAVKWTGAEAAVCLRIEKNPPMGDLDLRQQHLLRPDRGRCRGFDQRGKRRSLPAASRCSSITYTGTPGRRCRQSPRTFWCRAATRRRSWRTRGWATAWRGNRQVER